MKQLRGYAMVASGAFLWGCAATAAKLLLTRQVSTILMVQTSVTFSVVLMACALALFRRDLFAVRVKDLWRMALLGVVGIAGANYTCYVVIREASVAVAILLQYTAPLFVLAYAAFTREEELTASKLVAEERLSILQGAGAAPVLCAIVTLQMRREKGGEEIGEESHASG